MSICICISINIYMFINSHATSGTGPARFAQRRFAQRLRAKVSLRHRCVFVCFLPRGSIDRFVPHW